MQNKEKEKEKEKEIIEMIHVYNFYSSIHDIQREELELLRDNGIVVGWKVKGK